MQRKTIVLQGKVFSPFCIWSGEEWTILDYIIGQHGKTIEIIDQNWIYQAILDWVEKQDRLLDALAKGNFNLIQEIKQKLLHYHTKEIYPLSNAAFKTLAQLGNSRNQGFIKQHTCLPFSLAPIFPGSSIKGLLRSAYLFWLYHVKKRDLNDLEQENKSMKLLDEQLFKWLAVPDILLQNSELMIQQFTAHGKPKQSKNNRIPYWSSEWLTERGISLNVQSIVNWDFQVVIELQDHFYSGISDFFNAFDEILYHYSAILLQREQQIFDHIGYEWSFSFSLKNELEQGKFPLKLGMYKKSLAYRLDWENQIQSLNAHFKGKERQQASRKQGIGDKVLYFSEDQLPVGWIVLDRKS